MNQRLKFLLLSNLLFVFAGNLFVPLYSLFVLKIGGGVELAGLLFGVQFITSSIVGLFVIRLKDGTKLNQRLLKANFLMRGGAWMLVGIYPTIPALFITQALTGISDAIGTPAFNSLVSENLDSQNHIREWGIWELIKNPLIATAGILGGFIVSFLGFRFLFLSMSGLAFVSAVYYQISGAKHSTPK